MKKVDDLALELYKNSENEKEGEDALAQQNSPLMSPTSSTSSYTYTLRKMKSSDDIYARCNFCVLEKSDGRRDSRN